MGWVVAAVRVLTGVSRGGRGPYPGSLSAARMLVGLLRSRSVHLCVSGVADTTACAGRVVAKCGPASPLFIAPRRGRCRGGPAAEGRGRAASERSPYVLGRSSGKVDLSVCT